MESEVAQAVHEILSTPDDRLDYASAKLAIDSLIRPFDRDNVVKALEKLADEAWRLADDGGDIGKLTATT